MGERERFFSQALLVLFGGTYQGFIIPTEIEQDNYTTHFSDIYCKREESLSCKILKFLFFLWHHPNC